MEIKAELSKPYTEQEKINFIVRQNHILGYMIEEQKNKLVALGYTDEEKAKKERERINNISMSRGDFFEAMILAKGITKAKLRVLIENMDLDEKTKLIYLNRFDEALNFYRGYPIFNALSEQLGITGEQLDEFFVTKDYKKLLSEVNNG